MWVHGTPSILNEGRLVHLLPEAGEDEDPELLKKKVEAADPFQPRLKNLASDLYNNKPAWNVKLAGD